MIWLQMETCYKARSVVALRGANLNNNNNNNKEEEEEEENFIIKQIRTEGQRCLSTGWKEGLAAKDRRREKTRHIY